MGYELYSIKWLWIGFRGLIMLIFEGANWMEILWQPDGCWNVFSLW